MKIGIVGLGLIGGSLGLDFRALGHQIYGLSRSQKTCELAIRKRAADFASSDPSILTPAEVVFLCPPIASIPTVFAQIKPSLQPQAIVTDVGSVKGAIAPLLHQQWPYFIGGHPMAGTAESGIEAALSNLFSNRPYVLTPLDKTSSVALETVQELVKELNATLLLASPTDHDRAVSLISHLPIMASAALISTCMVRENDAVVTLAQALASSGFRDTSRVGGGNPELGRMVAEFNQEELLRSLDIYEQQIQALRETILQQDWEQLDFYLTQTQQARPAFLTE